MSVDEPPEVLEITKTSNDVDTNKSDPCIPTREKLMEHPVAIKLHHNSNHLAKTRKILFHANEDNSEVIK